MKRISLDQQTFLEWQRTAIAPKTFLVEINSLIQEVSACLKSGGMIIYPTETVYGIGVDAQNAQAVKKLLSYKGRREGKPLSIAVTGQRMAEEYVQINSQAQSFYDRFLPGPYTVVSLSKGKVAAGVASEFNTLGIRIPDYPLVKLILENFQGAMTSSSANASNKKQPYAIDDILSQLTEKQKKLIDLIIDVGKLPKRASSTVIDTTLSTPLTIRGGVLQKKSSEKILSKNQEETQDLSGRLLLKYWEKLTNTGLLFALNGELGMGKTIFAQGIGKNLGIKETLLSPTYSYMNEYPYQKNGKIGILYHIDAWKIENQQELDFLEIKKLFKKNNILVIEWWQQIDKFLPKKFRKERIQIDFSSAPNQASSKYSAQNLREISISEGKND